jgi:hypothetical protein
VAAGFYIIEGPPTVDAVAELDAKRPTVVMIDDRGYGDRMIIPRKSLHRQIGRVAEGLIIQQGVVPAENMIRSEDAMRVASTETAENPMSVVDVARAVGAEVIVYAEVKGFAISRDGSSVSPMARVDVKIFDAANNARIWPADAAYPLTVQLPRQARDLEQLDRNDIREVEELLAASIGEQIARMFYETQRPSRLGTTS